MMVESSIALTGSAKVHKSNDSHNLYILLVKILYRICMSVFS